MTPDERLRKRIVPHLFSSCGRARGAGPVGMFEGLPPDPPPIIGRATVVDGDTIEIHGHRIRLWGIDAPESRQTCTRAGQTYRCGQEAANALDRLVQDQVVECVPQGRPDRYRRIVARCTTARQIDGDRWFIVDLAAQQARDGHALDYPRYSFGAYAEAEATGREAGAGMWAGEFQRPWEWRAR